MTFMDLLSTSWPCPGQIDGSKTGLDDGGNNLGNLTSMFGCTCGSMGLLGINNFSDFTNLGFFSNIKDLGKTDTFKSISNLVALIY